MRLGCGTSLRFAAAVALRGVPQQRRRAPRRLEPPRQHSGTLRKRAQTARRSESGAARPRSARRGAPPPARARAALSFARGATDVALTGRQPRPWRPAASGARGTWRPRARAPRRRRSPPPPAASYRPWREDAARGGGERRRQKARVLRERVLNGALRNERARRHVVPPEMPKKLVCCTVKILKTLLRNMEREHYLAFV